MFRVLLALSLASLALSPAALPSRAQPRPQLPAARPELRGGSQGVAVRELQAALQLLGFYAGPIDGIYAELTVVAVSRFQAAANLPIDGVVGRATWNRLFPPVPPASAPAAANPTETAAPTDSGSAPNADAAARPVLRLGAQGDAVRRLQARLRALGFLDGAVDGDFGPATRAAVEAAQAEWGLAVDGVVGPATWEALWAD